MFSSKWMIGVAVISMIGLCMGDEMLGFEWSDGALHANPETQYHQNDFEQENELEDGKRQKKCQRTTDAGKCCNFPFSYKNKDWNKCSTLDNHGIPWCYTDDEGHWGECIYTCNKNTATDDINRCCKFPFTYNGQQYTKCTDVDESKLWCSLTSNYDADEKWEWCATGEKIVKGKCTRTTDDGKCCMFPFTYNHKTYTKCTDADYNGIDWCYTADNDGSWGECITPCAGRAVTHNHARCCKFPFIYKGQKYNKCTTVDEDKPWCATTSSYDDNGLWEFCGAA